MPGVQKYSKMIYKVKLFKLSFSQLIVAVVLLFINSPAFSIIALVTGFYFPNEKLAFLLVLLSLYIKKQLNLKKSLILYVSPAIILLVTGLRSILYQEPVYRPDTNLIFMLFAIPIYGKFFIKNEKNIFDCLHIITVIQIIIAGYQWVMMINGNYNEAMIFNNYPSQETYIYTPIFPGIYRVAGLFGESSQLSIYLSFYFVFYNFYKNGSQRITWLSCMCFISMILTFSMTGYLMTISYLMIRIIKSNKYKIIFICSLPVFWIVISVIFNSFYSSIVSYLGYRITANLEGGERFGSLLYYLDMAMNRLLTGYGASWEDADRYDFLSVYFYSYGIFGCLAVFTYILYLLKSLDLVFYALLVVTFSTNATLMMPAYVLIFSSLAVLKHHNQQLKSHHIFRFNGLIYKERPPSNVAFPGIKLYPKK